jgi:hypothetical protein
MLEGCVCDAARAVARGVDYAAGTIVFVVETILECALCFAFTLDLYKKSCCIMLSSMSQYSSEICAASSFRRGTISI